MIYIKLKGLKNVVSLYEPIATLPMMNDKQTIKKRQNTLFADVSKLPLGFIFGLGTGIALFVANERGKKKIAEKNKAIQLGFRVGKFVVPYLFYNVIGEIVKKRKK